MKTTPRKGWLPPLAWALAGAALVGGCPQPSASSKGQSDDRVVTASMQPPVLLSAAPVIAAAKQAKTQASFASR